MFRRGNCKKKMFLGLNKESSSKGSPFSPCDHKEKAHTKRFFSHSLLVSKTKPNYNNNNKKPDSKNKMKR